MTPGQIKAVLDRVLTPPSARQQDAAHLLLWREAREGEVCQPSDDEWAALQQGLEQARRGELVPEDEMHACWKRHLA